jgi:hypothetical protein
MYTAAIYSIVAAVAVLVIDATLKKWYLNTARISYWYHGNIMYKSIILDLKRHPHHRFQNFS